MGQFESFIGKPILMVRRFVSLTPSNLHCSEISFLAGSQHDRIQAERD